MLGALVVYLLYALCGKIYNTLCGECWLVAFRKGLGRYAQAHTAR